MKSKKLKKLIAATVVGTMVVTAAPVTAFAKWTRDSQNQWNFTEDGSKAVGWKLIDGNWYHFDANGKMQTGWVQTADYKWYYLISSGAMKTGWLKDTNGKWYYLESSGAMKTGWVKDTDGKWYFTDISGAMQTGVVEVQGKIYVLEASGAMATGSVVVAGITYTLDASGAVTGDKLPVPEKAFTNEGRVKDSNAAQNTKPETTSTSSESSSTSSSGHHHHSPGSSTLNVTSGQNLSCDNAGTYGVDSGTVEVNNVAVNTQGVTLKNMHIKGDLVLGEGIGEGDVYLENVTVDGTTTVQGGGENSVHIDNSVLATIIVNKNNGKIRIVVQGRSQVDEVQLESPAKLEESGLSGGATGFNDVNVTENVQTGNDSSGLSVELVGRFETINSRAANVRIQLDDNADVRSLILNVLAQIFGRGTINTAIINSGADGSSLSTRPQNMVLRAHSVSLRDQLGNTETINDSYSNATSTEMTDINLNMNSIKVTMDNFVAGLTESDFNITAKLDGEDCTLQHLRYDADNQRFTFDPVFLTGNIGKVLEVTIAPGTSGKVTGEVQADQVTVKNGFSGKITDVQGVGIAGVTINFRQGANSRDGEIVGTVVTDEDGYYTAYLVPGEYTGEISGSGIVKTYMYASSLSNTFNTDQNETAIRATGMDSVKIVLTWGARPYDEDSHLEGSTSDGGRFHTWYSDKIYEKDGIRYADLDWDDINSYGPETTTLYKLVDGKYRFYVHNYSGQNGGDLPLIGSGAKVEVYKGSNQTPVNIFTIPNDTSKADSIYWIVFGMNVADNGETINISEINEFRKSLILKIADTAEASYRIDNASYGPGENAYGRIYGVPVGTVADLKADISAYDGGVLKIVAAGTDVSDAEKFDAAQVLSNSTPLANGQKVAVKSQDGKIINVYSIILVGSVEDTIPPVIAPVTNENVTTSGAATWTPPTTTATDDVDGVITNVSMTYSSNDGPGSDVFDLSSARNHLGVEGNTVKVTYKASDAAGNTAWPVYATFTSIADDGTVVTTPAAVTVSIGTINDSTNTIVVPSATLLDEFKSAITTSAGVTFEVCEADGTTEADDLQSDYKLIVRAGDGSVVKIYTIRKEDIM